MQRSCCREEPRKLASLAPKPGEASYLARGGGGRGGSEGDEEEEKETVMKVLGRGRIGDGEGWKD